MFVGKKKEVQPKDHNILYSEILNIMNDINEESTSQVIPVIRSGLKEIFLIEHAYTFEELTTIINNFEKECDKRFKRVEDLNKKKQDFILKNKGKKRDKKFYTEIETIKHEIDIETEKFNTCKIIADSLNDDETKKRIMNFCDDITKIQFSGSKFQRQQLKKVIYEFLWIVNRFDYNNYNMILTKDKEKLDLKKEYKKFKELIKGAKHYLKYNDITDAKKEYKKAYDIYAIAPFELKNKMYDNLFNLWFTLHFNKE